MRRVLLLLVMLVFVGASSATDYYVATWGYNSSNGTSLDCAWSTLSHAQGQLSAGDTLYIVNGTYYNDTFMAQVNGTSANPITIKAYNGTPTFVETGTVRTLRLFQFHDTNVVANMPGPISYYVIDGIRVENYSRGIDICYDSHHIDVSNISTDQCSSGVFAGSNCHDITTTNMHLNGSHWNAWYIWHDNYNITATDVYITNQVEHSFFDLHTNNDNITLINCRAIASDDNAPGVYMGHGDYGTDDNVTIINFTYADVLHGHVINAWNPGDNLYIDTISCTGSKGVQFMGTGTNLTLKNAYIRIADAVLAHGVYFTTVSSIGGVLLENVTVKNVNNAAYYYDFKFENGFDVTKNVAMRDLWGDDRNYNIMIGTGTPVGSHVLEYSDGMVFSATNYNPQYYPDKSNISMWNKSTTITTYNITLCPTYAYLCNVTMNHESDASDDHTNISVNSTVTTNPTWINATMQNATHNYSIAVDGSIVDYVIADSGGVVRYQYTSSWSPHDFEFKWVDRGTFSPDHFKAYYDQTSLIENTVNSTGYHVYNRSLRWDDTVCSSGSLKVII